MISPPPHSCVQGSEVSIPSPTPSQPRISAIYPQAKRLDSPSVTLPGKSTGLPTLSEPSHAAPQLLCDGLPGTTQGDDGGPSLLPPPLGKPLENAALSRSDFYRNQAFAFFSKLPRPPAAPRSPTRVVPTDTPPPAPAARTMNPVDAAPAGLPVKRTPVHDSMGATQAQNAAKISAMHPPRPECPLGATGELAVTSDCADASSALSPLAASATTAPTVHPPVHNNTSATQAQHAATAPAAPALTETAARANTTTSVATPLPTTPTPPCTSPILAAASATGASTCHAPTPDAAHLNSILVPARRSSRSAALKSGLSTCPSTLSAGKKGNTVRRSSSLPTTAASAGPNTAKLARAKSLDSSAKSLPGTRVTRSRSLTMSRQATSLLSEEARVLAPGAIPAPFCGANDEGGPAPLGNVSTHPCAPPRPRASSVPSGSHAASAELENKRKGVWHIIISLAIRIVEENRLKSSSPVKALQRAYDDSCVDPRYASLLNSICWIRSHCADKEQLRVVDADFPAALHGNNHKSTRATVRAFLQCNTRATRTAQIKADLKNGWLPLRKTGVGISTVLSVMAEPAFFDAASEFTMRYYLPRSLVEVLSTHGLLYAIQLLPPGHRSRIDAAGLLAAILSRRDAVEGASLLAGNAHSFPVRYWQTGVKPPVSAYARATYRPSGDATEGNEYMATMFGVLAPHRDQSITKHKPRPRHAYMAGGRLEAAPPPAFKKCLQKLGGEKRSFSLPFSSFSIDVSLHHARAIINMVITALPSYPHPPPHMAKLKWLVACETSAISDLCKIADCNAIHARRLLKSTLNVLIGGGTVLTVISEWKRDEDTPLSAKPSFIQQTDAWGSPLDPACAQLLVTYFDDLREELKEWRVWAWKLGLLKTEWLIRAGRKLVARDKGSSKSYNLDPFQKALSVACIHLLLEQENALVTYWASLTTEISQLVAKELSIPLTSTQCSVTSFVHDELIYNIPGLSEPLRPTLAAMIGKMLCDAAAEALGQGRLPGCVRERVAHNLLQVPLPGASEPPLPPTPLSHSVAVLLEEAALTSTPLVDASVRPPSSPRSRCPGCEGWHPHKPEQCPLLLVTPPGADEKALQKFLMWVELPPDKSGSGFCDGSGSRATPPVKVSSGSPLDFCTLSLRDGDCKTVVVDPLSSCTSVIPTLVTTRALDASNDTLISSTSCPPMTSAVVALATTSAFVAADAARACATETGTGRQPTAKVAREEGATGGTQSAAVSSPAGAGLLGGAPGAMAGAGAGGGACPGRRKARLSRRRWQLLTQPPRPKGGPLSLLSWLPRHSVSGVSFALLA